MEVSAELTYCQYVVRYYALQYREDLVGLLENQQPPSTLWNTRDMRKWIEDERDAILDELLAFLSTVPVIALGM